jgi:hypothetical protein
LDRKKIHTLYTGTGLKIFKKQVTNTVKVDTSVVVLLDMSGSMKSPRKEGSLHVGKPKCVIAAAAVAKLLKFYQDVGVDCCLCGYHDAKHPDAAKSTADTLSYTGITERARHQISCTLELVKGFDQGVKPRDIIKMLSSESIYTSTNSDHTAIVMAADMLRYRPGNNKVIIVVSDGLPSSLNERAISYLGNIVQAHPAEGFLRPRNIPVMSDGRVQKGLIPFTREVVRKVRREGIAVKCVSIDAQGNKEIYGSAESEFVRDPESFEEAFFKINKKVLIGDK